jgi:hypothetical protein
MAQQPNAPAGNYQTGYQAGLAAARKGGAKVCDHTPLPDGAGRIVSPYRDYGRGLGGAFMCMRCGRQISETDARNALGLTQDEPI